MEPGPHWRPWMALSSSAAGRGPRPTPRESCLEWGWEGGLGKASCLGKAKGVEGWVVGHNEVVTRGEGMLGVGGADTGTHTHTHTLAHTQPARQSGQCVWALRAQ